MYVFLCTSVILVHTWLQKEPVAYLSINETAQSMKISSNGCKKQKVYTCRVKGYIARRVMMSSRVMRRAKQDEESCRVHERI